MASTTETEPIDLSKRPISLPGQPRGSRLTMVDVHHICEPESYYPWAITDRAFSDQEAAAIVKLAFYVARQRGSDTIGLLSVDEMLKSSNLICPLTFERGPHLWQGQIFSYCWDPCPALDFYGQLLGWLPWDMWGCQGKKQRLWNTVPVHDNLDMSMSRQQGAIVPTMRQLRKLVVELEIRLANTISSAGTTSWTLSTEFGESTALTSVELEATTRSTRQRSRAPTLLYAHEYDWVHYYAWTSLDVYDDSATDRHVYHSAPGWVTLDTHEDGLNIYDPPLPSFASFISPAAAVAKWVYDANYRLLVWRTKEQEDLYDLSVYFSELCAVTSGKGFADVVARRPKVRRLSKLTKDVQSCLRAHGSDESHRRCFPAFEDAVPERKRSREEEEEEEEPVKLLKTAISQYQAARYAHNRKAIELFDHGRGFSLFELLRRDEWRAVYEVVGAEDAEELKRLQNVAMYAQEDVQKRYRQVVGYPYSW